MCLCLNAGLTASPINLIFSMHTHIRRDCAIGYLILTFEVIKGHFRSNKFLCKVPLAEGEISPQLEGAEGEIPPQLEGKLKVRVHLLERSTH